MLQVSQISKQYKTGDLVQTALKEISLNLRDNEFVAILGPSGSGKTTLLNIIGGLDRYDSGDLIINGISTKKFKDKDWDSYRNHTIGFVFQSYNLIPHQSILANVELALTISGISRKERRRRAKQALEQVGLGNQVHKKPNQMSGGQMQRVAIARALVNNPDVLLADEPTGALDSETSIQVMELLKEVAKDRLVVMVTHNPELAEQYATRIVKVRDGSIVHDSNPFEVETTEPAPQKQKKLGKASMSFLTSLALSFTNLRTKKGRTLLTAFAGSIGIIGIALILALSTGVNEWINNTQKDTMTSYPLSIQDETIDMNSLMSSRSSGGMSPGPRGKSSESTASRNGVYADSSALEKQSAITENNLTDFKKYLDNPNSEIHKYLGENGIVYSYKLSFDVFVKGTDGKMMNTNTDPDPDDDSPFGNMMNAQSPFMTSGSSNSKADNFEQLMPGNDGSLVSKVTTDSYEVVSGNWPKKDTEVVLVLNEDNAISTKSLYQLGLLSHDEYKKIESQLKNKEKADEPTWKYADVVGKTFRLIPTSDYYVKNDNGTFSDVSDNEAEQQRLLDESMKLKVVGVIRPVKDAANAVLSAPVAYTKALTDTLIAHTDQSPVVVAQEKTPKINVLNNLEFTVSTDDQKVEQAKKYISQMSVSDKASMYSLIQYNNSSSNDSANSSASQQMPSGMGQQSGMTGAGAGQESALAAAMDQWLEKTPDKDFLLSLYDKSIADHTYDDNLKNFGKVSYDTPSTINIYADTFEDKDSISDCITAYNKTVDKDSQIVYTDYVALMTSFTTSIVNIISYVLIAFVSVSLIVSCIMIGIITNISVLERTKEIGILRALGASKRNISQVFNAETFIIGICSGLLGVVLSVLLTFPINALIHRLSDSTDLNASLSPLYAVILVVISVLITVLAGLLPARKAAKKDPVIALRSE